ncbi:glycoside hydrolase family 2 protein [Ereboglobus luteus]|uniref:Beta-galactosidase n=1 Tax=Ereboglobus luteus TaxID=1796921 RepID=A0A2U8DZZ1_9BACT|nr:sugar-binding domain-containing protein [Ereboglobus luteus]AWI08159.1 beta-galactosidase [Ereboglobus luteus]
MKHTAFPIFVISLALSCAVSAAAPDPWAPAGNRIKTPWAGQVSSANPLPEYPRPRMVRTDWQNLNGLWDYAIKPKGAARPATFDGRILVPFPVESSLSGVQREVGPDNELWYKLEFTVPSAAAWKGKNVLLHFGAVDWRADVYVNGDPVGSHTGGFAPFTFDITRSLNASGPNTLVVRVWDPTDASDNPVGKQSRNPYKIWYTAVTGIWQTVWLEPVAPNHIKDIQAVSDIDAGTLAVTVDTAASATVEVELVDNNKIVATARGNAGEALTLTLKNPTLWSPENPKLYDLRARLLSGGKTADEIRSYAAFRKISMKRDASGMVRMQLNGKNYFHFGPLDQGWWPDGLYTAPTDEALLFDIIKTKELGFNMIRKHVKVEPQRWYYHCDREGILVWQDMPSTHSYGLGAKWGRNTLGGGIDTLRTPLSKDNFQKEWGEIMDFCKGHPSVVVWVPFNEAWGQFDTERIAKWTKERDPSRLVNAASGGNMRACGDIVDFHHYPEPRMFPGYTNLALVLGEYGGLALPLPGHLWQQDDKNWGYGKVKFAGKDDLTAKYVEYTKMLKAMVAEGYSAAVYTQTTDVEIEANGFYTYDRKILKMDAAAVRAANRAVIDALLEK